MKWKELKFWEIGEWQVLQERLADILVAGQNYCPGKKNLFRAMTLVPFDLVKVAIIGQDPYPDPDLATGVAFSIPDDRTLPPTLQCIFKEYDNDLHYGTPKSGNLEKWCKEGVFLWNAIPTCEAWKSLSHETGEWEHWKLLTTEIIQELDNKEIIFVLLGGRARDYAKLIKKSPVIEAAHPSPRASLKAKAPFLGSRIFSKVNDLLTEEGLKPIDWRL